MACEYAQHGFVFRMSRLRSSASGYAQWRDYRWQSQLDNFIHIFKLRLQFYYAEQDTVNILFYFPFSRNADMFLEMIPNGEISEI